MLKKKVILSKRGEEYLNNRNCSAIVGAVLNSIKRNSAEVIDESGEIIRVKLFESNIPREILENNDFAVHKKHLKVV